MRVEWFTHQKLSGLYNTIPKNQQSEQLLEDDLRLFLFDNGVDYPFSTPKSISGRADIVGLIDSEDPLIVEIKIIDKKKGYGKQRVFGGISQIFKYANDYNKNVGYLVIFNFDPIEINFKIDSSNGVPCLIFNSRTYYIILINMSEPVQASKIGRLKSVEISSDELIKSLEEIK